MVCAACSCVALVFALTHLHKFSLFVSVRLFCLVSVRTTPAFPSHMCFSNRGRKIDGTKSSKSCIGFVLRTIGFMFL